ncbi:MAG: hypothetical protein ACHRHE_00280 [Tepidisphaerales bacterium]
MLRYFISQLAIMSFAAASFAQTQRPALMVLPLSFNGPAGETWIPQDIQDSLMAESGRQQIAILVAPPNRLPAPGTDQDALAVGRDNHADLVLMGNCDAQNLALHVNAQLYNCSTGMVVGQLAASGRIDRLADFEAGLYGQLATAIGSPAGVPAEPAPVPAVAAPNPAFGYSGAYGYVPPAVYTYPYEPGCDYGPALDSLYFGWGGDMLYPGYSGWGYYGFCNDGRHHRDHDGNGARLHQGTAFGGSLHGSASGASAHQGAIGRATAPSPAVSTSGPMFHSQSLTAGSLGGRAPLFSPRFTPAPTYRSSISAPRFAPSPVYSPGFSSGHSGGGFSHWGGGGGTASRGGFSHGGGGGYSHGGGGGGRR